MHLRKRMTFHGVEYLVVPVELWEEAKENVIALIGFAEQEGQTHVEVGARDFHANMLAYEGSNEPEELNDE
jgi:hypothetical protein